MSWFEYGTPARRSLRKGVWLRVHNLPEPIVGPTAWERLLALD